MPWTAVLNRAKAGRVAGPEPPLRVVDVDGRDYIKIPLPPSTFDLIIDFSKTPLDADLSFVLPVV